MTPFTMGRTSGSAPLSSCPGRFGIAAILISPRELLIVRSHTAGDWDTPTPLLMPFISPGWPRCSPEMSSPPAPTATTAWRSRVNTDSPIGWPGAGFSRAGPAPKEVKRRRELPASATVWPQPRRPAPAYSHRSTSPQAGLDEPAIEWWGKAGDQALHRSAFKEATAHLGKAIELADRLAERVGTAPSAAPDSNRLRLQISLGNALIWTKGYQAPET